MFIIFFFFPMVFPYEIRHDLRSHKNWKMVDIEDNCGESYTDRIIGGREASLGQYPWMARLHYELTCQIPGSSNVTKIIDSYNCGGTIINNRYILTAAHCSSEAATSKFKPKLAGLPENLECHFNLVQVRLGEHNINSDPDCLNGICAPKVQDIDVEKNECHNEYNSTTFQNDICLIRLAKPIEFTEFVNPICLPAYNTFLGSNFTNTYMDVAGWGMMDIVSQNGSDTLQTLKVAVAPSKKCATFYLPKGLVIGSNQMCAGGLVGEDSCSGDSGGPLMKPYSLNAPARYFLIGIVSFGFDNCGSSEKPAVYTRVAEYMPWILDTIRE